MSAGVTLVIGLSQALHIRAAAESHVVLSLKVLTKSLEEHLAQDTQFWRRPGFTKMR